MSYFDQINKELIECKKTFTLDGKKFKLETYSDLMDSAVKELDTATINDCISWGYTALDSKIGYIMKGQLIVVGGLTGSGKSTFVGEIASNVSKQGIYVGHVSLEDRAEDRKKNELFFEINKIRKKNNLTFYNYNDFISNSIKGDEYETLKSVAQTNLKKRHEHILYLNNHEDTQINISKLEGIVKQMLDRKIKLIILDHLQEFEAEGEKNDRQDQKIEAMMYQIKGFTRKYNIAIILIAHYKKIDKKPNDSSFKDSIAITQVANKVIHIHRDKLDFSSMTEIIITKNRERGDGTGIIEANFDFTENRYTFNKSKLQSQREIGAMKI